MARRGGGSLDLFTLALLAGGGYLAYRSGLLDSVAAKVGLPPGATARNPLGDLFGKLGGTAPVYGPNNLPRGMVLQNGVYYWTDSSKGNPQPGYSYLQAFLQVTPDELRQYGLA